MKELLTSGRFRKDVELARRRGKDLRKLRDVIALLSAGAQLAKAYRDHPLKGEFQGYRDCHLEPDWVLIYAETTKSVHLVRTGTHSDLFG